VGGRGSREKRNWVLWIRSQTTERSNQPSPRRSIEPENMVMQSTSAVRVQTIIAHTNHKPQVQLQLRQRVATDKNHLPLRKSKVIGNGARE